MTRDRRPLATLDPQRRRRFPCGPATVHRGRRAAPRTWSFSPPRWESNSSGYVVLDEMQTRFHGLTFVSDPGRVFSPRATTEKLVDAALERIGPEPARVADIGTGAGVVAITLALRAPTVEVWASDTCANALRLASANAERLGAHPHPAHGHLPEGLPRDLDLTAPNPPYPPPGTPGSQADPPPAAFSTAT